jgi:hypothetical protein
VRRVVRVEAQTVRVKLRVVPAAVIMSVLLGNVACSSSPAAKPAVTVTKMSTITATVTASAPTSTTKQPESCMPVSHGADGNVAPVLCPDGHPNAYAQPVLGGTSPAMFALGQFASSDDISQAGCTDLRHGSTNPLETGAYEWMTALNGWNFGIDPSDGGIWSSC